MTVSRSPIVTCTAAAGAAWPVRSCTTAVSMCAAAAHAAATAAATAAVTAAATAAAARIAYGATASGSAA